MFDIKVSTIIGRPVADVFAYYVEPGNRPQWSDHVLDGRWLTAGPIGVGSVFQITLRQWGRTLRTDREITVYERDRRLCYTMDTAYMHVASYQTFEPVAARTRFTILASLQLRGLLRLLEPILQRQQARHLAEEAANLKRALETDIDGRCRINTQDRSSQAESPRTKTAGGKGACNRVQRHPTMR